MRGLALALVLAAAGGSARAQDWTALAGDDLVAAFKSRVLQYDYGAVQEFRPSGVTTYSHGALLDGLWWVDDNLLCTLWTQSDRKHCFSVERKSTGLDLRLSGKDGGTMTLRYIDLQ